MKKKSITLNVNGVNHSLEIYPWRTLLDVIRNELNLIGTKSACEKGECGACTVIIDGKAVPSCCILAKSAEGKKILTIEGLEKNHKLHPLQQAYIDAGAVQCGFCLPGFIMTSYALLEKNPNPTYEEIKDALSGNLCRCTGYKKIIEAVQLAVEYYGHQSA